MDVLNTLYSVQILSNVIFTTIDSQLTPRGILECSTWCQFECTGFMFDKHTSICSIIKNIETIVPPPFIPARKIWTRNIKKYNTKKESCLNETGYVYLESKNGVETACLKFDKSTADWDNAHLQCNGKLVQLHTLSKSEMLTSYILSKAPDLDVWFWLGLKRRVGDVKYTWEDGTVVNGSDSRWIFYQNNGDTQCVVALTRWENFKWREISCWSSLRFVCEKDL